MTSNTQLEIPLFPSPPQPKFTAQHLDFPLQAQAIQAGPYELRRLESRWGSRQTLRSLRLHGLR
jgi:hypothetical protein